LFSDGINLTFDLNVQIRDYENNISKEYNLEIATKKTKVFGFVGTDHLRTKIIINVETPEQVSQFTYLGCSISY
jgi:hypothetical protein